MTGKVDYSYTFTPFLVSFFFSPQKNLVEWLLKIPPDFVWSQLSKPYGISLSLKKDPSHRPVAVPTAHNQS